MNAKRQGKKTRDKPQAASVVPAADSLPALRFRIGLVTILMIVGVCVLYPELCFQGKVLYAGDVEAAISYATPIQQAMEEADVYPLWNPYLYAGMPSYESLSYLPYVYVPGLISRFLVDVLRFPEITWLLSHIFLLGIGMAALLMDRGVNVLVASLAGILMMWMPNHVAVSAHGHGSQAMAVAFIPFALMLWDRLWRGKGVLLNASILLILLGFQLLRAHLQISYYTLALLAMHLLYFGAMQIHDAVRGRSGDAARPHFTPRGGSPDGVATPRTALARVGTATAIFVVIVVGALLISSVLFLPVRDYAQYSIRGASESGGLDYDYATSWSLHPSEATTFLVPFASGFGKETYTGRMPFTDYPNYVGLVVLLFAVIGVIVVRERYVRFLVFITVITTLVAFGRFVPVLFDPLFKLLPYFNKFRVPVMVLIVQQFALVVLFALGLSAFLRLDPGVWRRRMVFVFIGAGFAVFVSVVTSEYWTGAYAESIAPRIRNVRTAADQVLLARQAGEFLHHDLIKQSIIVFLAAGVSWLFMRRSLKALPLVIILAGVACADFYMVNRHILHPENLWGREEYRLLTDREERDAFLQEDGVIRFLRSDPGMFRVFPIYHPSAPMLRDFRTNRYGNFGISSLGGYHPAKLSAYQEFMDAMEVALKNGDYRVIDMLNAKYLIASNPMPDGPSLRMVWQGTDYRGGQRAIYENLRVLPRVYFVDRFEVAEKSRTLAAIASGFDPTAGVFLDREPDVTPVSAVGATATIESFRLNEIRVAAALPEAAIMILSEIYYPKWNLLVNGRAGEIIRANHVLRAVALPAGEHELVFRYDSGLLKRSLGISVFTLALAFVVLGAAVFLRNRGRAVASVDRHPDVQ